MPHTKKIIITLKKYIDSGSKREFLAHLREFSARTHIHIL